MAVLGLPGPAGCGDAEVVLDAVREAAPPRLGAEPHGATREDRRMSRLDAGGADNRRDDQISVTGRGLDHRFAPSRHLGARAGKRLLERRIAVFIAHGGEFGVGGASDLRKSFRIAAASDGGDGKLFRLALQQVDGGAAH